MVPHFNPFGFAYNIKMGKNKNESTNKRNEANEWTDEKVKFIYLHIHVKIYKHDSKSHMAIGNVIAVTRAPFLTPANTHARTHTVNRWQKVKCNRNIKEKWEEK